MEAFRTGLGVLRSGISHIPPPERLLVYANVACYTGKLNEVDSPTTEVW